MSKSEQQPYVQIGIFHELGTGLLVGVSPFHMTSFHEAEKDRTVFRFLNGQTVTVEEDFYTVLTAFGQRKPPRSV